MNIAWLKAELKAYQKAFGSQHGRQPGKADLNPEMSERQARQHLICTYFRPSTEEKYRIYYKLKGTESKQTITLKQYPALCNSAALRPQDRGQMVAVSNAADKNLSDDALQIEPPIVAKEIPTQTKPSVQQSQAPPSKFNDRTFPNEIWLFSIIPALDLSSLVYLAVTCKELRGLCEVDRDDLIKSDEQKARGKDSIWGKRAHKYGFTRSLGMNRDFLWWNLCWGLTDHASYCDECSELFASPFLLQLLLYFAYKDSRIVRWKSEWRKVRSLRLPSHR